MNFRIAESVCQIIRPVLTSEGMELIDIEYRREGKGWVLRLFIDKKGGVTLDDCTNVSHQIGDLIEVKEIIDHPYILEVSSPGLNRPLKNISDFERFKGKQVKIKARKLIDGRRNFKGTLMGYDRGIVRIAIDSEIYGIPYKEIVKANLIYDF